MSLGPTRIVTPLGTRLVPDRLFVSNLMRLNANGLAVHLRQKAAVNSTNTDNNSNRPKSMVMAKIHLATSLRGS